MTQTRPARPVMRARPAALGAGGLDLAREVRERTDRPLVSEVVDPPHAAGRRDRFTPMAFAAVGRPLPASP